MKEKLESKMDFEELVNKDLPEIDCITDKSVEVTKRWLNGNRVGAGFYAVGSRQEFNSKKPNIFVRIYDRIKNYF